VRFEFDVEGDKIDGVYMDQIFDPESNQFYAVMVYDHEFNNDLMKLMVQYLRKLHGEGECGPDCPVSKLMREAQEQRRRGIEKALMYQLLMELKEMTPDENWEPSDRYSPWAP
jgi:hypothetical protein